MFVLLALLAFSPYLYLNTALSCEHFFDVCSLSMEKEIVAKREEHLLCDCSYLPYFLQNSSEKVEHVLRHVFIMSNFGGRHKSCAIEV